MFDGITVTTLMTDVALILPELAGGTAIIVAFFGVRKLIRGFKSLLGRV